MPSTTTSAAGIQDAARHLAEGRPAEAVAVLERLVADFPAYVTAHVLLAKAYEANGRTIEALEAWHHAYFLMPGSPLIVRERTRLLRIAPTAPVEPEEWPAPAEPAAAETAEVQPEESKVAPEEAEPEVEPVEPEIGHVEAEPEAEAKPEAERIEPGVEPESAPDEGPLGEVDDLDTLIHQLETAPRIRPDPDFRDEGLEEEDEDEGLVSETLARIYAAQKQYAEAARAYEQLAEQHPSRAAEFEAKAAEMHDLAAS